MWLLIFALATSGDYRSGTGASVAEFNNKEACMQAAELLRQDANHRRNAVFSVLVCAPKGEKKGGAA